MRQETPESMDDCGATMVKDDAPPNLTPLGGPLGGPAPDETQLPPIDPKNPGPGIDARLKLAIDALSRAHPDTPKEQFFLGL